MLKEMVIDGIRPPQLSAIAQPTVVLANQQQSAVNIILFLSFQLQKNKLVLIMKII